MQKIMTVALFSLYCFAMTKATVNLHYCCDKFVTFSVNKEVKCAHDKPLKEGIHTKSCCADVIVSIISDLHVPQVPTSIKKKLANLFPIQQLMIGSNFFVIDSNSVGIDSRAGPQASVDSKLYISNSSFIFYG